MPPVVSFQANPIHPPIVLSDQREHTLGQTALIIAALSRREDFSYALSVDREESLTWLFLSVAWQDSSVGSSLRMTGN
jgi:hypothetical protein